MFAHLTIKWMVQVPFCTHVFNSCKSCLRSSTTKNLIYVSTTAKSPSALIASNRQGVTIASCKSSAQGPAGSERLTHLCWLSRFAFAASFKLMRVSLSHSNRKLGPVIWLRTNVSNRKIYRRVSKQKLRTKSICHDLSKVMRFAGLSRDSQIGDHCL